jgi:hypothetical protein
MAGGAPLKAQSLMERTLIISRRRVLAKGSLAIGAALAAASLPCSSFAGAKTPKAQAGYRNSPNSGAECDKCQQFEPPSGCKIVEGQVSPSGWCTFFAAKTR